MKEGMLESLKDIVKASEIPVVLVGFSAGANLVCRAARELEAEGFTGRILHWHLVGCRTGWDAMWIRARVDAN